MGKRTINVSNDFFEMDGSEQDVMYSFVGNCGSMRSDNVLYGKTINLSRMYGCMLDDVREFLFLGEFVNSDEYVRVSGDRSIMYAVNKYTFDRYGLSIKWVYNIMNGFDGKSVMTVDILFGEMKRKYGVVNIDWMYLYNNVSQFMTNDVDVLKYIGDSILGNGLYEYFVRGYGLSIQGIISDSTRRSCLSLKWDGLRMSKSVRLSSLMKNKSQWWTMMTNDRNRVKIRDYDKLLGGSRESEILPEYCPVFSNLRMNYTGIDFDNRGKNIKKCSDVAGYSDKGETWSFASIDRIDSSKGYSYDNIRIISHYANNLKNVGNIDQMRILLRYMDEQNSYI